MHEKGILCHGFAVPFQLDLVLTKFHDLFQTLDVIFSLLRILDPTKDEIGKIEKSIAMLEIQWKELDLTQPPKLHILLDHTFEQVRFLMVLLI